MTIVRTFLCTVLLATGVTCVAQAPNPAPGHGVPDPAFHKPSKNFDTPIGVFTGQSDVGSAVVAGSASYDSSTKAYTINSAGYNVWFTRDEFRYLWKKMSGDVSMAADVVFPDPKGFADRKAMLVIRQTLDDDSPEVIAGLHGGAMVSLASRPVKGTVVRDMEYRLGGRNIDGGTTSALVPVNAKRIGLEKHGDEFTFWVSIDGEPMHPLGSPMKLHLDGPFYVGIGFCAHVPDKVDTGVMSRVLMENAAGRVK